jgi:hypothetical protein
VGGGGGVGVGQAAKSWNVPSQSNDALIIDVVEHGN